MLNYLQSGVLLSNYPFDDMLAPIITLILIVAKDYSFFWLNLFISLTVQTLVIFIRPAYLISNTKTSFRFSSVFFSIITLLLFFFNEELYKAYSNYLSDFSTKEYIIKELSMHFGSIEFIYTRDYFEKLLKALFLPYTIGTLIGLFILELREKSNSIKAKKSYLFFLNQDRNNLSTTHIKRVIYYGESYYLFLLLNNHKIHQYRDLIKYDKLFEDIQSKSITSRINNIFNKFSNRKSC
ncbi:MAG: hypothetical protein JJT76_06045 [Clostridiaceae bacterium]|nr:hypothetical protein [Clostridiaceae bacterium]